MAIQDRQFSQVVIPLPNELPASYCSRVAWGNGFRSLADLCSVTLLTRKNVPLMLDSVAERVSVWTGVTKDDLQRYSFRSGVVIPFGYSSVKRKQLEVLKTRFCSDCLRSDLDNNALPPGGQQYLRGPWSWKKITRCHIHGTRLHTSDTDFYQATSLSELAFEPQQDAEAHSVNDVDRYLYSRITEPAGVDYLDQFPAYVVTEFCEVLGQFATGRLNGEGQSTSVNIEVSSDLLRSGYQIARDGRQAVWDFLTSYVEGSSTNTVRSARMIYAPAVHWLTANRYLQEYHPLMVLFQEHAEEHVAIAPGEVFLWPALRQKVHTLPTASQAYGLTEERIRTVLVDRLGLDPLPTFLKDKDIHLPLLDAQSYVTDEKACRLLGCAMTELRELIDDGYMGTTMCERGDTHLIHQIDIDDIMEKLARLVAANNRDDLVPAWKMEDRIPIMKLILSGHLKSVACSSEPLSIGKLLVDPLEVDALRDINAWRPKKKRIQMHEGMIETKEAKKRLGVSDTVIQAMVDAGLVRKQVMRNEIQWNSRSRTWLNVEDIDLFEKNYVSAIQLALIREENVTDVIRSIESAGVRPVVRGARYFMRFYDRDNITKLGMT